MNLVVIYAQHVSLMIQSENYKTVSSNSRKVTYSDFSIRVYDEQYGNNSGAGIYYDRESISYKLTFTPS